MTRKQAESYARTVDALRDLGFDLSEIDTLLRIERTLQRWGERECGDDHGGIMRDEKTGRPYWQNAHTGKMFPVPDRESGALRRLNHIMERHPELIAHHQTDPRGCALYVMRKADLPAGSEIESCYTRGVACCY